MSQQKGTVIVMKPIFSASLMCMDFLHVEEDLKALEKGCCMFHADIMDGHYAKNITLSPDFIRAVKSIARLPVDAHLMVTDPDNYLDTLIKIKVDYLSLHLETINNNAFRLMRKIKQAGIKFGLVLNPATPIAAAEYLLSEIDLLTIMTVDVGYSSQPFISPMLEKITKARQLKEQKGCSYIIQADGGCGPGTYGDLWKAGTEAFVMGTTGLFGRGNTIAQGCEIMRREFKEAIKTEVEE